MFKWYVGTKGFIRKYLSNDILWCVTRSFFFLEVWCSGNTAVSKTENRGSIPLTSANKYIDGKI